MYFPYFLLPTAQKIYLIISYYFIQCIFLAICQIRLDFDTVQTVAPLLAADAAGNGIGSCTSDTIAFTSPSGKNPPTYCGDISGTHSK